MVDQFPLTQRFRHREYDREVRFDQVHRRVILSP
jgi:hypothetical protein